MKCISDNGVSQTWREGNWCYKRQPKFMTDSEIWCLETLYYSGYVPKAEQVELEVIRLEWIEEKPVTDVAHFKDHYHPILRVLENAGIRHGDLTDRNILVRDNHPYIIDWSESRMICDPRPDKRPEGDRHWLKIAMEKLSE